MNRWSSGEGKISKGSLDNKGKYNGEKIHFWNYWELLEDKLKERKVFYILDDELVPLEPQAYRRRDQEAAADEKIICDHLRDLRLYRQDVDLAMTLIKQSLNDVVLSRLIPITSDPHLTDERLKLKKVIEYLKRSEGGRSQIITSAILQEMDEIPIAVDEDSLNHLMTKLRYFNENLRRRGDTPLLDEQLTTRLFRKCQFSFLPDLIFQIQKGEELCSYDAACSLVRESLEMNNHFEKRRRRREAADDLSYGSFEDSSEPKEHQRKRQMTHSLQQEEGVSRRGPR
jgi:hypothetical protein